MAEINLLKEQPLDRPETERPESADLATAETDATTETTQESSELKQEKTTEGEELKEGKIRFIPPKAAKKDLRAVRPPRDPVFIKVENILEEDLREQFEKMSPVAQQEFKLQGEETAYQIRELLKSAHLKVKKIFRLIADWLSMIPGVNRFFLEQEAKIKTDKIIAIKKQNGD